MPKIEKKLPNEKCLTGDAGSSFNTLDLPCQSQTTYQLRARSKSFSLILAVNLAEEAKRVGSKMEQRYRDAIYCSGIVTQENGTLTARYCGCRWCLVCNRVRTARAIKAYSPVIEQWSSPNMVTLTVRNVPAVELPATLDLMREKFTACLRSIRRTFHLAVTAVRKLEITYNIDADTYHPHFHIVIDGEEQAYLLRDLWLRRLGDRAELDGQDVRPCKEGSLKELFKYSTKLVTTTKDKNKRPIPIAALHVIFEALRGRRVWQPCGFKLPKEVEESIEGEEIEVKGSPAFKREEEKVYWYWDQKRNDWTDTNGEPLSDYIPSEHDLRIMALIEGAKIPPRTLAERSLPDG